MEIKKKHTIEKTILMVPLFMAFLWMGYLVLDTQQLEPNVKLAPSKLNGLINALFAFIIVYSIVLLIMFIKMNKELKLELSHPPAEIKKAIKKKVKKK